MLNFKIHTLTHIVKTILGNIEYLFTSLNLNKNELYVVNYHGTQKIFMANLKKQIVFFKKHFTIISPSEIEKFYTNKLPKTDKPYLLITFDDGIKNNMYAEEVLNESAIKALFFIVPRFINAPIENQKEYFLKNIRPEINPHIDSIIEDFQALSWNDIQNVLKKGHSVGSHTYTHTLVSKNSTFENSNYEIVKSKLIIEKHIHSHLNSFCSINNTLESVGETELSLIKKYYQFHFTTIPGPNFSDSDPYFIKRVNIESFWLSGAVKYALGKWNLKRWKTKGELFLELLNKS